jgi:hypothetical protein
MISNQGFNVEVFRWKCIGLAGWEKLRVAGKKT